MFNDISREDFIGHDVSTFRDHAQVMSLLELLTLIFVADDDQISQC